MTRFWMAGLWVPMLLGCLSVAQAQTRDVFDGLRARLVEEDIIGAGIEDERVIKSIRTTPRHEFVPLNLRRDAYIDTALPIGEQQTISPPYIVAFMTESLDPQPSDRVLEIGTGSGYQAAVLSPLVKEVYTIEIVEKLGRTAAATLKKLNYDNVFCRIGDGFQGWPDKAPFDKIIVTCSPEKVPQPLIDQLREGGRMVIPLGQRFQQTMFLLKKENGKLVPVALKPTLFVPMTGRAESLREVEPDPENPEIANGSFETLIERKIENPEPDGPKTEQVLAGWHYLRYGKVTADKLSPDGEQYLRFVNNVPGRMAGCVQGFAIDGRKVGQLAVGAMVKATDVRVGQRPEQLPVINVTFYDEQRRPVGEDWIGPWFDSFDWTARKGLLRVPIKARSAIMQIGLMGGTGEVSFDNVKIKAIPKSGR